MTNDEEKLFATVVRALAAACRVPQFRCEVFDERGNEGIVVAVGARACMQSFWTGDGRCGPGGAAALLRSIAMLASGGTPITEALGHAARLTFDTDEQFDKMFPLTSTERN